MSEVQVKIVQVETASPEALAPFGVILNGNESVEPLPIDLYNGTVKVRRIGKFISDETTELPVCTLQRRPLVATHMERHFKHTQTFVPLGGKPFVVLFAPPTDTELPNLDDAKAFLFDGSAGFMMHIGTWHEFPFAVLDNTDVITILRAEATDDLKVDNVIGNEAVGNDIEKRDMVARFGVRIELKM